MEEEKKQWHTCPNCDNGDNYNKECEYCYGYGGYYE